MNEFRSMPIVESEFASLRDPRFAAQLADHALSPSPAWLWSTDGTQILWANAVGAAIFGAADASARARLRFDPKETPAAEVIRLARALPSSGQTRLERLRGFGAGFGRPLTCACTRVALGDGKPAVLIAAVEPAGPALTVRERVRRLFADRGQALAVFAPDGALLYATAAATARLAGAATLSALGIEESAARALASGSAAGTTPDGPVDIERLGSNASTALVLTFGPAPGGASAAERAEPERKPAIAAAAPQSPMAAPPP
ncbi:MAG TPA: PAS domain-containing sensor histidine kinase, partial [Xanthobacteraceae bacterium]|nr:PAS domain-containing sensor histidine kinase [Xanthobacteraceae bacterium]